MAYGLLIGYKVARQFESHPLHQLVAQFFDSRRIDRNSQGHANDVAFVIRLDVANLKPDASSVCSRIGTGSSNSPRSASESSVFGILITCAKNAHLAGSGAPGSPEN